MKMVHFGNVGSYFWIVRYTQLILICQNVWLQFKITPFDLMLSESERERERLEPQCKSIFSDPYHPHLTMRSGHLQHLTSNWAYRMWWYCYASLPCVSSFDLVSCCLLPSFGFIFVWFPLFHVSSLFNAHTNISPAVYLDCINNKNDLGCLPPHARLNWRWILYSVRRSSFAIDTLQQQQNYSIIFVVSSPFIQIQCAPTDSRLFIPFRIPYAHSLCFSIFLLFFLTSYVCLHITPKKIVLFLSFRAFH